MAKPLGKAKVDGAEELKRTLWLIDDKVKNKALRKGVNNAAGIVLRRAKSKVPVRTKTLKKSLGRKVRVYRGSRRIVGVVGPRTKRKTQIGVVKRGKRAGQPIFEIPTKISHLAEKAQPFMEPALDESKSDATDAVAATVREVLKK